MINKNISQSGRSMIEMLGVLAIIGVLSVGGIAGYSKAMEKFKINKTIDQISHIVANTRSLFIQQKNYAGLNSVIAHNVGIIPDEMWNNTDNEAYNVYGGRVHVNETYLYQKGAFLLSFENISKEACIALATHDWRQLHPYIYVVGEWQSIDEWVAMVDDLSSQGIIDLNKDQIKIEQSNFKNGSYGVNWYLNFLDFEPLSPADAAVACNNSDDDSNLYHIVFAFQ